MKTHTEAVAVGHAAAGVGAVVSASIDRIGDDLFALRCGCCPTGVVPPFDSLLRADRIVPVPGMNRFCFESTGTLEIDFGPDGLLVCRRGAIGIYLRIPGSVDTCTAFMTGRSKFFPHVEGSREEYSWDPIDCRRGGEGRGTGDFGVLLGLKDVSRIDRISLHFVTDSPGAICIEVLGYALIDLEPDQVARRDLLGSESRVVHDAGRDAGLWRPSEVLQPVAEGITVERVKRYIDGDDSILVLGDVRDPLEFVAVDRTFEHEPLDLGEADLLHLWVYASPGELGAVFVLELRDVGGASLRFGPVSVAKGWQRVLCDLGPARRSSGLRQVNRVSVGLASLGPGTRSGFRLDTIRAARKAEAGTRTREYLGLPAPAPRSEGREGSPR